MPISSLLASAPPHVAVRRRVQPIPATDLSRMTRYRGGTYSHTVDTIVFADGTSARTDLIRLNPNIEAYSLDFAGVAPTTPSRYRADTWAAVPHLQARAHEAEVDWILRNSYPVLSTAEISRRLRAAGYPLGNRNIADHEAIAGTQAAIWRLTNGLQLDDRPLGVPVRMDVSRTGVTVEFDGERQLAGYSAVVSSRGEAVLTLQKSHDGVVWDEVASSRVRVAAGSDLVVMANADANAPDSLGRAPACGTWMHSKKLVTMVIGMHSGSRPNGAGAKLRAFGLPSNFGLRPSAFTAAGFVLASTGRTLPFCWPYGFPFAGARPLV